MNNLNTILNRLESLVNGGMESIVERAADGQTSLMERLQVEQLQAGERSDGSRITPPYSPLTVRLKRRKGQPVDRVTGKDTGAMHNSITVEKHNKALYLHFRDSKAEKFLQKYGFNVEGLQPDNITRVAVAMMPDIRSELRKLLKL